MSTIRAKTLVVGSTMRVIEFVASILVALALTPFMIHSLGDKMYGLWMLIWSFIGYFGLLDFGLWSAIQRYISRSAGINDRDEINKIINTSFGILIVLGGVVLVISFGVAMLIPMLIKNITEIALFRMAVIILGISTAFRFPFSVFGGILGAHARYDLTATVELVILTVRTSLIVFVLRSGHGILALVFICFILDIGRYAAYYLLTRRLYSYVTFSKKFFDKFRIKKLFGYSAYTFIALLADEIRFNIDNLVIVIFIGLNPVTLYSIGARLIRNLMMFMSSAMEITMPMFSQYEGKNDYSSIREKYLFLMKISSYMALLIGGMLIILGRPFIIRWVGIKYAGAYPILLILLIPFIFDVMQIPGNSALYGISKHKYYMISNSIEGVCNLVLSLILVRFYGLYGVALGTAIPMFIMKVFIQPVYTCKVLGLQSRQFYVDLMLPIVTLSSVTLGVLWFLMQKFIQPVYLNIFVLLLLGASIFIIVVYILGFREDEKEIFRRTLSFGNVQ